MFRRFTTCCLLAAGSLVLSPALRAQDVVLPAPRLLTILPMGGQIGTAFEVTISGNFLEGTEALLFSQPGIVAQPKLDAGGKAEPNKFTVTIGAETPVGIYEARVMSRLGVSSSRAFTVGTLPELTRAKPNTSLATALELPLNSVCNAVLTKKAIDYYTLTAAAGTRVIVECVAAGIDSKLTPVLIIGDQSGRDLAVNRSSGILDFTMPADGKVVIKTHSLTFQGGPEQFYRLAITEASAGGPIPRQPSTDRVSSFSWNSDDKQRFPTIEEIEPTKDKAGPQPISLPCQISGSFAQAADVDVYQFEAKKGEVWWIEVLSERLGLATDPFVVVQRVKKPGLQEELVDVLELNDIPAAIPLSTNTGNGYIGPPYDAGSSDVLGKLEVKEDGVFRLQIRDLLGGTRSDPSNIYKLIIRKAAPDFTLVAWPMHMDLRNQDRCVFPKPVALRSGNTMAFEVTALRKDGFDGAIDLSVEDLPPGVTATGLRIPAGKSAGTLLITAKEEATRTFGVAKIFGRAQINNVEVRHPCRLASVIWPIRDAARETPSTRLVGDVPVSVGGAENAAISVAPAEDKVWEAKVGGQLTIPLKVTWRGEATGAFKLKAFAGALAARPDLNVPLKAASVDAVLDLAALKAVPGDYTLAYYGSAVTKHRHNAASVTLAEEADKAAGMALEQTTAATKELTESAKLAAPELKAEAEKAAQAAVQKQKAAEAAKLESAKLLKAATEAAMPKDIADMVVTEPIRISIKPADSK